MCSNHIIPSVKTFNNYKNVDESSLIGRASGCGSEGLGFKSLDSSSNNCLFGGIGRHGRLKICSFL